MVLPCSASLPARRRARGKAVRPRLACNRRSLTRPMRRRMRSAAARSPSRSAKRSWTRARPAAGGASPAPMRRRSRARRPPGRPGRPAARRRRRPGRESGSFMRRSPRGRSPASPSRDGRHAAPEGVGVLRRGTAGEVVGIGALGRIGIRGEGVESGARLDHQAGDPAGAAQQFGAGEQRGPAGPRDLGPRQRELLGFDAAVADEVRGHRALEPALRVGLPVGCRRAVRAAADEKGQGRQNSARAIVGRRNHAARHRVRRRARPGSSAGTSRPNSARRHGSFTSVSRANGHLRLTSLISCSTLRRLASTSPRSAPRSSVATRALRADRLRFRQHGVDLLQLARASASRPRELRPPWRALPAPRRRGRGPACRLARPGRRAGPAARWCGPAQQQLLRARCRCRAARPSRRPGPCSFSVSVCTLSRLSLSGESGAVMRVQVLQQLAGRRDQARQLGGGIAAQHRALGAVGQRRIGQHAAVGAQVGAADEAAHEREHAGRAQPVRVLARHVDEDARIAVRRQLDAAHAADRKARERHVHADDARLPNRRRSAPGAASARTRRARTSGTAPSRQTSTTISTSSAAAFSARWRHRGRGRRLLEAFGSVVALSSSCPPARRLRSAGSRRTCAPAPAARVPRPSRRARAGPARRHRDQADREAQEQRLQPKTSETSGLNTWPTVRV